MFPREEVGEGGSFETNQLERLTRSLVTIRNYLSSLDSFLRERAIFERVSKFSLFRTPLSRYVSSFHAAHVKSRSSGFRERSMERCFSARESRNKFRFFFFSPPLFFISAPRPARKKKTGFIGVTRGRLRFHRSDE